MKKLILVTAVTMSLSACGGEVEHSVNNLFHPNKHKATEQTAQVVPTLPAVQTPEPAKEPAKLVQRVPQIMTAGYQAPNLQQIISPKPLYQKVPSLQLVPFKTPSLVSNSIITPSKIPNRVPTLNQSPVINKILAPYKVPSLTPSVDPQINPSMIAQLTPNKMLTTSIITPPRLLIDATPKLIASSVPMKTPGIALPYEPKQLSIGKTPILEPQLPKESLAPSLLSIVTPNKLPNGQEPQLSPHIPLSPSIALPIEPPRLNTAKEPILAPELPLEPSLTPIVEPASLDNEKVPELIAISQPEPLEPELITAVEPNELGNGEAPVLETQNPVRDLTPSEFPIPIPDTQSEPQLPVCHFNRGDIHHSQMDDGLLVSDRYSFHDNTCNPLYSISHLTNNQGPVPTESITYQNVDRMTVHGWEVKDVTVKAHAKVERKPTKEQKALGALFCFAEMSRTTEYDVVTHRSYVSWCNGAYSQRIEEVTLQQVDGNEKWKYDELINKELSDSIKDMYYKYSSQVLHDSGYSAPRLN